MNGDHIEDSEEKVTSVPEIRSEELKLGSQKYKASGSVTQAVKSRTSEK